MSGPELRRAEFIFGSPNARAGRRFGYAVESATVGMTQSRSQPIVGTARRRSKPEHDPDNWEPVFGKDHAQTKS